MDYYKEIPYRHSRRFTFKKTHSDCNNMHKTCISPTQNKSQNVGVVVVTQSYT